MKNFEGVSDEALALLYVKGDNRAFDELLSRTQTKLFTYIMFVVRDHDIADDIWITRIAHNCIMDWYRQQQSAHIVDANEENDLQNLKNASVMDSNKEAEMINEQILIDIKKMMNTLPAPQREVVYMRYFQQLSFKEIADLTGVSINTSLGRMRYALINLRKMAKDNKIELALCEY